MVTFIKIEKSAYQLEKIIRAEYVQSEKEFRDSDQRARSALRVFTTDGKEFTLFNEKADILWDVICSSSLTLG